MAVVSNADEKTYYVTAETQNGFVDLSIYKTDGLNAFSESGRTAFTEDGDATRVKLSSTGTIAKLLYYYCVKYNYMGTEAKKLKVQNALSYLHNVKKGLTDAEKEKAQSMIEKAKNVKLPTYAHVNVYRYTMVDGKKPTFIAFQNAPKIKVAVTWENEKCPAAVKLYGAGSEILPMTSSKARAMEYLEDFDALILPGGHSVCPSLYGDSVTYGSNGDIARDRSEMAYIDAAIELDMPVLAICRGHELVNVFQKGTLFQSTKYEWKSTIKHSGGVHHKIKVYSNTLLGNILGAGTYSVYSSHYQCLGKVGNNLKVNARANDGIVESTNLKGKTFFLTLQFHPEKEDVLNTPYANKIFTRFLSEAQKYKSNRKPNN